ncbi:MAG: MarR family transcriptional regulator [Pseudomonadota bacterium]
MTDVRTPIPPLFLREAELRRGIELLFFVNRDFDRDADALLSAHDLGRAHHRVLHFVGRQPGLTVSELLSFLRVTKQSLSRVLKDLLGAEYVRQTVGEVDRRQRCLRLTEKGHGLERQLSAIQQKRIAAAYRAAGPEAVAGFWTVLMHMLDEPDRLLVQAFVDDARAVGSFAIDG